MPRFGSVHPMVAVLLFLPLLRVQANEPATTDKCFDPDKQADSCQCLLSCKVFGGDTSQCGAHQGTQLDTVVRGVVTDAIEIKDKGGDFGKEDTVCKGIECIVKCAQQLGCLNEDIMGKCLNLEERDPTCNVDCNTSYHQGPAMLFLVATIAMSLSFGM